MDYNLLDESQKWRHSREKRLSVFVRLTSWLMVIGSFSWLFVYNSFWLTTMTVLLMTVPGIVSLVLLSRERLAAARFLCFSSVTGYFLLACILTAGSLNVVNGQQQVHFWFLVLASFSYFFLYDIKPWLRDAIPAALLLLFFIFHFGLIRLPVFMSYPDVDLMNRATISLALLSLFLITRQFVLQIVRAEEALAFSADRLESLIGSMLPKKIAERLQREQKTFADVHPACSVLFADISGFTTWAEQRPPDAVAAQLNKIFSRFDGLTEKHGLTKIKTIGDSYMVASGIPTSRDDHAQALIRLALEMLESAAEEGPFSFRIGINSGSVVAGIIGRNTFNYDLWGDTVNIASRMESSGEPGKINISAATYELVRKDFDCRNHGKYFTRSKGEIDMYFVDRKKSGQSSID